MTTTVPLSFSRALTSRQRKRNLEALVDTTCKLMSVLSLLLKARQTFGISMAIYGLAGGVSGALLAVAFAGAVTYAAVNLTEPTKLGVLQFALCSALTGFHVFGESGGPGFDGVLTHWANDPPDPDYRTVPSPALVDVTALSNHELGEQFDKLRAHLLASLQAFERFQTAEASGDMPYVHAQSRAVADNMLEFTTIAREAADGVDELAAELETSFPVEDWTIHSRRARRGTGRARARGVRRVHERGDRTAHVARSRRSADRGPASRHDLLGCFVGDARRQRRRCAQFARQRPPRRC